LKNENQLKIIYFFQIYGNQRLTTIQGVLIQEKWLKLGKNFEVCVFLAFPISLSPSLQEPLKSMSWLAAPGEDT
jgi:hypothetical protein